MSSNVPQPPPLGEPWHINGGANVNFDRNPPPPPISCDPYHQYTPNNPQSQQHAGFQTAIPTIGIHIGPPPMLAMGIMPFSPFGGIGMGMPFGVQSAGPLAIPRSPWNTPGLMGNPSTKLGACVPGMPGVGYASGEVPAPPGVEVGGPVAAFAEGVSVLGGGPESGFVAGGHGLGMGIMGMPGMGMCGIFSQRPVPAMITEASGLEQPEQTDITQLPGGIPPGATHIESGEHTLVHLLKAPPGLDGNYPFYPWLNHGNAMEVEILHLSSSTGMNRMIQICMMDPNADAEGWALSECHEMVNGMWEKGQTFVFNEAMSRVLTVKDAGWDNKRNRPGGQSLHVFLHRV